MLHRFLREGDVLGADGVEEDVLEVEIEHADAARSEGIDALRDLLAAAHHVGAQDATGAVDAAHASVLREAVDRRYRVIEDRLDDFLAALQAVDLALKHE